MKNLPSQMSDCLDALYQCRSNHGGSDAMNVSQVPSAVCALQIAQQFAAKAADRLSQHQFHQLLQFLRGPAHGKVQNMELLEQFLARKLEQFHSTEVEISGEDRDRLARPGGPADANLGLILHVQCEDGALGGFWDSRSATISLLHEKRIHETFAFGYDWHWRAQGSFHRNGRCPASAWNQQLRKFHNQFSSDLLEMLPLPFVITTSSCTRDNLRKYLPKTAMSLEIELAALASVLRFDLDIRIDGTLRRIILHVPHPTAGFFTSRKNRGSMAIQIDAGMNFILWLIGKDCNPTSFVNRYSGSRPRFVHTAPLPEMWGYVRKEAVEGKRLRLEDYSASFLSWVCRYIGHDPALVLATGASLAGTAAKKIVSRIHKRSTTTSRSTPFQVAEPSGSDNQECERHPQQDQETDSKRQAPVALLHVPSSAPPILIQETSSMSLPVKPLRGSPNKSKKRSQDDLGNERRQEEHRQHTVPEISHVELEQESKERSQKKSCPEGCQQQSFVVTLREHVYQGLQPALAKIEGGVRELKPGAVLGEGRSPVKSMRAPTDTFSEVIVKPQHALTSVNDESTCNSTNTSAAHSRNISPSILYRPLVDEIDIPMPLDDSYEDDDEDQELPIESEAGSDEAGKPTTCHGTAVKVYKNGRVIISSAEFPLEFRTSKTQAQKICSFGSTPRIYFSPTDIEIRVNKEVVYTKPIERLLGSLEGAEWLSQLILEKQAFRGTPHEDEHAEAEPHSGLDLISHERHGSTYKNGELKRKLLQGANFHCAQLKSRGAHTENRVFFRGVQLTVPLKANTQTVCIRVDLVPEGTVHPHECINGGEAGDPAHRLSIQIRYRTMHENAQEELWYKNSAQGNIKKLNSLVDFLEDKDGDWTAKQPRRFLVRDYSRKRFKTSYTN